MQTKQAEERALCSCVAWQCHTLLDHVCSLDSDIIMMVKHEKKRSLSEAELR